MVAARAVNGAKPGSIILVHDIHASTVAAVDAIVKGLKNRGYELVTVSELIRRGRAAAGHAPSMPAAPAVPDSSPLVVPAMVAPRKGGFPLNGHTHRRLDLLVNFSTILCRIIHTQSGLKCL